MWRAHTSRQGRQVLNACRRHLAAEAGQGSVPPPIPPPPPKSGGFGFLKFLGVSVPLAGGGTVGYAWYDPEFRKQLETNVPYAKELLENVLPASEAEAAPVRPEKPVLAPALGNASVLSVQDDVAKQSSQVSAPTFPLSWVKMARCASEDQIGFAKRRRYKRKKKPDSYLSYCQATTDCEKPNEQDDINLKEDNEEDDEDSEDGINGKTHLLSEQRLDMAEVLVFHEDTEKEITEKLMSNTQNPLHDITDLDVTKYLSYGPYVSYLGHTEMSAAIEPQKSLASAEEKKTGVSDEPKAMDPFLKKEEEEKADNAALEVAIHRLLTNSQTLTEEAVKAQQDVANFTRSHTKLLKQAMDETSDILKKDDQWQAVAVAFKEKENAVHRSNELVSETKKSIEKLQDVLANSKNNKVTKNNPAIFPATKKVVELTKELGTANSQVRQAESEAKVLLKYKDLVEKGRKQFQKELESLMPDVKLGTTSKKLTEEELNSLIAHAHRRIEQLQRQLAEQMAMERQRLSTAMEAQRHEDHGITLAAVADERSRLQAEFESEKQKLEMEFLVRQEGEVRKQLSRQAAAHSDHIKDVLAVQREQLNLDFNRELNAKILEEREKFQTEVAGWISRLKGIEAAVDARAASEKLARCAQDLWLACIALNSLIHFGNEDGSEALIPIRKEVEAVLNVGNKHPFVETVANAMPEAALERGVYTEEQLRKRFVKVSSVCRRLGLINESNTSLYKYLISFLHSFVVFDNITVLTPTDPVDLNSIDNYGLVAHAQHWMERGDLEMALKFMNQLTGEARRAASDWIREASLLLETRQAASTLTAYASATGLANTF
ncbi:MICOS complex subunit MIC60 isoform X2 [Aplysia californica]|uniref:MICOS complex subunit MIC60 n=1 Tax=Aplysia californica TaxID=6500 RepID=A0ABM1W455_APLCA|nr:MICOS complex subunit MIC60 isoform X2 [Aplysia californica]